MIVIGGGLAGCMAAVAAARSGCSVLLAEKYGCLGGMATTGLVNPFCRYFEGGEGRLANAGLFSEMISRLYALGGCDNPRPRNFAEEHLKIVLDRMTAEAGVRVLFHSLLTGVETGGGRITSVTVSGISGNIRLTADTFIDATGNADLTAYAGLGFHVGRESDGRCQPMTLFFRICGVDWDRFNKAGIIEKYRQFYAEGKINNGYEKIMLFRLPLRDIMHFNSTRVNGKDPLDVEQLSAAEAEGREQCFALYSFLKENASGLESCGYLQTAAEIGIRESRRIIGGYELTADDILSTRKFDDSIARGTYCIDIHNPTGGDIYVKHIPDNDYYTIPYRSLIPLGIDNLIVAGRPICATHEAHAAIRIMPIAASIGQAAGVAAAVCHAGNTSPANADILKIRSSLTAAGALI